MGPLTNTASNYLNLLNNEDIIIACATPSSGPMGISIIRISGLFDVNQFNSMIKISGPMGPLKPRKSTMIHVLDPNTSLSLDTGLATYFPAPNSFTGESVMELSLHGNPRLIEKIIDLFIVFYNLRHAEPGEFTLRAYKNKKLNLSQVEGLDLLLHATTQPLIELSQYMLSGELQNEFFNFKLCFDNHQASIDILTDFSEDIGEETGFNNLFKSWNQIKEYVTDFYNRSLVPMDHLIKPNIVLFGPPNAGKSTLFNILLGYKRSLVSTEAGTTRDYIKESFFYDHNEFLLIDTAGIRESDNSLESEGIVFTHKNLRDAFVRVLIFSAINFSSEDFNNFIKLGSPSLIIITHVDKNSVSPLILSNINKLSLKIPVIFVDLLIDSFDKNLFGKIILADLISYYSYKPIVSNRQRIEIIKIYKLMLYYDSLIKSDNGTDMALLSNEFRALRSSANGLIGLVNVDEILGHIFNNFCIGK